MAAASVHVHDSTLSAAGLEVRTTKEKGRGLYALKGFKQGQTIFAETPIVSVPLWYRSKHKRDALRCHHCLRFIGTTGEQLESLSGSQLPQQLPGLTAQSAVLSQRVPCKNAGQGCQQEYCSSHCRDTAAGSYHLRLCVGAVQANQRAALENFIALSFTEHQFFLMAARLAAAHLQRKQHQRSGAHSEHKEEDLLSELAPMTGRPWWDCAGLEDIADEAERHRRRQQMKSDATKAWQLLRTVLFASDEEAVQEKWFSFDFFAGLLGLLRLNNISVDISSPLTEYFMIVDALKGAERERACAILGPIAKVLHERQTAAQAEEAKKDVNTGDSDEELEEEEEDEEEEDEDEEDDEVANFEWSWPAQAGSGARQKILFQSSVFPYSRGSALYRHLACLNHSCSPNVSVEHGTNHEGILLAQEDIKPGDELSISYVDFDLHVDDRRSLLREYGFDCCCKKCREEENEENDDEIGSD